MPNKNIFLIVLAIIVVLLIGLFLNTHRGQPAGKEKLPPPPAVTGEGTSQPLPKVITLYQKGEGESDLAAFVARELSHDKKISARFNVIDVLQEPQMAEYYGVNNAPAVIFITSAGKVFRKYEGYIDKHKILKTLAEMQKI